MRRFYFQIITFMVLFSSCKAKQEKTNPQRENLTESVYASGIVKSRDQYQVFSPVNGLIQQILVKEGDTVKKDEILLLVKSDAARLNTENARLASEYASVATSSDKLNELLANIGFLKSKISNDSLLLERQRHLWMQQIGTRNELEQREMALKNDVAAYNAAHFRYRDLQKQLNLSAAQSENNLKINKALAGDFEIRSQVNGRIYSLSKEPGEMITTQTPVAVIGGNSDFMIELQVDEYDIGRIKTGQKILLTMDSYKGKVYEATLTRIIPFMNERTRSFTVEGTFTTPPPLMYPNLSVEANIIIHTKEHVITIPRDYLVNDSMVIIKGGKRKKVEIGLKDYQLVEILNGISTTDEIIKPSE